MVSEEEMQKVFETVGNGFGFEKVTAEFKAFKDFKVKWSRGFNWADFQISDYLACAGVKEIEELANVVMGKIKGMDVDYSVDFNQFCKGEEFRSYAIPMYVKRLRNKTEITDECRVPDDVRVFVVKDMIKSFSSSRLMRVVLISDKTPKEFRQECVNVSMLDMNFDVGEVSESMRERTNELREKIARSC